MGMLAIESEVKEQLQASSVQHSNVDFMSPDLNGVFF